MPAKATSAFLEWKRRTSPISALSWGPRAGPTPNIRITMGYSGSEAARDCISFLSAVKEMEVARSWETACSTRSLAVSLLGMTLKCPQAEAQMSSAVS